ncbi:hypothetical protein [Vibrio mangrovi]|uniref:Uncharacterized protein n=1 Tax=Vibrio mangrovi TaxID=474394 RepID=A0A1Y6IR83_9VIBR|nr:hypothetical protein [Vibrio mangrovi]MDW6004200.1 hypothetical protein [Vibrio mangrovi]SMR99002.1 hypothetical protein VIM7927_00224 [Vibrio mangrovi]
MFNKNILLTILLIFLSTYTLTAKAEAGRREGTIQYIRVHEAQEYPDWAPPMFWFTLNEVADAGTCPLWNGRVLFAMSSNMALSLILSANMADKTLSVKYDDTKRNGSWCKATYVTLGKDAPL